MRPYTLAISSSVADCSVAMHLLKCSQWTETTPAQALGISSSGERIANNRACNEHLETVTSNWDSWEVARVW
eukprot:3466751-Pleurochrysis_carterae.AAC.2